MPKSNLYALAMIATLKHLSVDHFALAPGLRSTPFAAALSEESPPKDMIHYDERALGFYALGYAKVSKRPAPIFVTSGSSLANLMPAVVEAKANHIPMILITADRPFYLRESGANQTIDQVKFFQNQVTFQQDLPLWKEDIALNFLATTIEQAVLQSQKGPVHLNCQFDEPFLKEITSSDRAVFANWQKSLSLNNTPLKSQFKLKGLKPLNREDKGLIIIGKDTPLKENLAIKELAKKLNWPVFADILASGHLDSKPPFIKHYDLLLKHMDETSFDVVLQFKDTFTSKSLLQALKKWPLKEYIQVTEKEERIDPLHLAGTRIFADIKSYCEQVEIQGMCFPDHLEEWVELDNIASKEVQNTIEHSDFSEQHAVYKMIQSLEKDSLLFLGASLPIRTALSLGYNEERLIVHGNRGASGIDGNLATAFGLSQGANRPVTLLCGDLTCLYDMNALSLVRDLKHPPRIIVLNNAGGGIFSHLPQLKDENKHKRYFQTEHPWRFEALASLFHLKYRRVENHNDLEELPPQREPELVEVLSPIENTLAFSKQLDTHLKSCLESKLMETRASLS